MNTRLKFLPAAIRTFLLVAGIALTAVAYIFLNLLIKQPSSFAFISFTIYTFITFLFIVLGIEGLRQIRLEDEEVIVMFFGGLVKFKNHKIVSVNTSVLSNRLGTYPSIVLEFENGQRYQISEFETKNFNKIKALLLYKHPLNKNLKSANFSTLTLSLSIFLGSFLLWTIVLSALGK